MICNAYTSPLRTVRAFKFRHLCWGKPSAYLMACTRLVIVSWNRLNLYRRLQKTLCKSRKSTLSLMRYFDGPTLTRLTSYKHRLFPLPLTQQSAVTLLDKQQNFQRQRSPPPPPPWWRDGGGNGIRASGLNTCVYASWRLTIYTLIYSDWSKQQALPVHQDLAASIFGDVLINVPTYKSKK